MSSSHLLTSLLSPLEAVAGGEAAVPSYLLTTAEAPPPEPEDGDEGGLEDILQVFKIFKLARVLKLARHSPGLQAGYDQAL